MVAPPALVDGFVHLQRVLELEQIDHACAVVDQAVEGRQQRGPSLEWQPQLFGVHPPLAGHALDDGRLARVAHVDRLDRGLRAARSSDAQ